MKSTATPATLVGLLEATVRRRRRAPWLVYAAADRTRRCWSYHESFDGARRLASYLAQLGVGAGDRVAIVSPNRPEVYFVYLACWLAGAVACPIGVEERTDRKRFVLEHSACSVVVVARERRGEVEAIAAELPQLTVALPIEELLQLAAGEAPIALWEHPDPTPAFLVYTSGTTGDPKGVVWDQLGQLEAKEGVLFAMKSCLSNQIGHMSKRPKQFMLNRGDSKGVLLDHGNLRSNAQATAAWHRLGDGDGLLTVLPIHHVNGAVVTGLSAFVAGGRTLLEPAFSPRHFWRRLAEERAVTASVVPTLLEFLLEADEDLSGYDLSALRYLLCGAGPLLVDTVLRFEERFAVAICHGFGMSETTAYNTQFPMELSDAERRSWYGRHGFPSVGSALACNDVAVLRPDGSEASPLERGEIAVRGPTVMRGYLDDEAANARAFRDGWFLSGDQGFFDHDGVGRRHLFVCGRLKELIVRGGVNLNPLEIDEVIRAFPGVAFALTFGFPNRYYGDEVAAFVVPADGVKLVEAELHAFLAERLPHALRPKALLFGSEVPFTATGKPRRLALAERLSPQLAHLFAVQHEEQHRDMS